MSSCYPQIDRAEALMPFVECLAPTYGLEGWKARPFLDAQSIDVVVRIDNAERVWLGLDAEFRSLDLRFHAHEVFLGLQDSKGLEQLLRDGFESVKQR